MTPGSTAPGGADGAGVAAYAAALESALAKLPPHDGVVLRVAELTPAALESYRAAALSGTTLTERGFISATQLLDAALEGDGILAIESRTGRDVSLLSQDPSTREVVFAAGSRFEVLAVLSAPERTTAVLLREPGADDAVPRAQTRTRLEAALAERARLLGSGPSRQLPDPSRFTGLVGLDDSGRPFAAPAHPAPGEPLNELERLVVAAAAGDAAARTRLLAQLARAELFAVVEVDAPVTPDAEGRLRAGPRSAPRLIPADIGDRTVLPAYTARERIDAATGGRRLVTRVPGAVLLRATAPSLPLVLNAGVWPSLELGEKDVAIALEVAP